jgi:hypothetical protein
MSKSRTPLVLGLAAAGGVGYYLYNAGGNAKAAEKKFESQFLFHSFSHSLLHMRFTTSPLAITDFALLGDMHRAAASAKSHLPGSKPDAEKEMKHYGAETGAKIDKAVSTADKKLGEAKSNAEAMAKDAKASVLQSIDKADRKIEDGASKAKSWWGGSAK